MLTLLSRPKYGGGLHKSIPAPALGAAEPSALLTHLAGEFAGEIARVWTAPHAPFVLADAGRRHLVCLALALAETAAVRSGPDFVRIATDGAFKRCVADLIPGAPSGLVRALGRLGETAWTAVDYRLLLSLLAAPAAGKVLRHANAISVQEVRSLGALPTMLTEEGGILLRLTEDQSRLAATCFAGVLHRDGPERGKALARRWAAARTVKSLFEMVDKDISITSSEPFHPGTPRLRPLSTRKALDDASRRYHNCLDKRELGPRLHYYEWAGPPGVIVEVSADPLWGWVLDEGRLKENAVVPPDVRQAITADLRSMGVHVGGDRWDLRYAMQSAADEGFTFDDEVKQIASAFGE